MCGTNVGAMTSTALPADQQAAARAGTLEPNDFTDLNPSSARAAGAAIATAQDVRVYAEALVDGRLLDGATQRQRLERATPTNPADPASPGYGLALAPLGPLLGHTGAIPASRPSWATTRNGT